MRKQKRNAARLSAEGGWQRRRHHAESLPDAAVMEAGEIRPQFGTRKKKIETILNNISNLCPRVGSWRLIGFGSRIHPDGIAILSGTKSNMADATKHTRPYPSYRYQSNSISGNKRGR